MDPGRHVVSFVAPDGRRVTRVINLEVDQKERLVFDFDRWDYR